MMDAINVNVQVQQQAQSNVQTPEMLNYDPPTVAVGTTTTIEAGESASVANVGTAKNLVLNFSIPKGDKGDKGDPGTPGVNGADMDLSNLTSTGEDHFAKKDLSNVTKPHVTETYSNGSSWYRVWSDGWCEQGGQVNRGNTDTVNLLVTMADTNYSIFMFSRDGHVYAYQNTASSTTSFKFNSADDNTDNNTGTFYWEVKGYKAS